MDTDASHPEQGDLHNSYGKDHSSSDISERTHQNDDEVAPIPWAQIKRHFPEYEVTRVAPVLQPIYLLRLVVEAVERKPLPTMAVYALKAIALGADTVPKVAHLLGLDECDLAVAAADLLKLELIEQQAPELVQNQVVGRRLAVTRQGQEALKDPGALPSPKVNSCRLGYNSLTGEIVPWNDAWNAAKAAREGLFALPDLKTRPTLVDLSIEEVSQAARGIRNLDGAEITGLLDLRPPQRFYRLVTLISLQRAEERRIVLFRGVSYLPAESAALHQRYLAGDFELPSDAEDLVPKHAPLPHGSNSAIRALAARAQEDNERIQQLEQLIARLRNGEDVVTSETNSVADQARSTGTAVAALPSEDDQPQQLQLLEAQLRLAREEAQQLRDKLAHQFRIKLLRTEEHRPVLEQALREAQRELFIISPWMNRRACNDTLCNLIASALRRGVRVVIGYSIGEDTRNPQDTERQENNARSVLNALRGRLTVESSERLEIYRTRGTHQKILIQDDVLAVNSSFNWLSYLGQRDSEYRYETGTLLRTQEDLASIRTEVMETLRDAERVSLRPLGDR